MSLATLCTRYKCIHALAYVDVYPELCTHQHTRYGTTWVYLIRRQQWHNKSSRLQSHLPPFNPQTTDCLVPSNAFIIIFNCVYPFSFSKLFSSIIKSYLRIYLLSFAPLSHLYSLLSVTLFTFWAQSGFTSRNSRKKYFFCCSYVRSHVHMWWNEKYNFLYALIAIKILKECITIVR